MKFEKNFWWPDSDEKCHKVVYMEVGDLKHALRHLPPTRRRVCVQAGGNVGIWPLQLARYFEHVITFEPDYENFECLVKNTEGHHNIVKIQAALSNTAVPIKMVEPETEKNNCGALQMIPTTKSYGIPSLCLDSLCLHDVDFLCLDIEGAEWLAISGAWQTIRRSLPVIMIEDKGLGKEYGVLENQIATYMQDSLRYVVGDTIHGGRDQILVPTDASDLLKLHT
jgi:FkbM family methyltransferase